MLYVKVKPIIELKEAAIAAVYMNKLEFRKIEK